MEYNIINSLNMSKEIYKPLGDDKFAARCEMPSTLHLSLVSDNTTSTIVDSPTIPQPEDFDRSMCGVFEFERVELPEELKDKPIPPDVYTEYFAAGKIPLAANGEYSAHDENHISGYERMFQIRLIADTVRLAAEKSVGDIDNCRLFTMAIDKLGDEVTLADFPGETKYQFNFFHTPSSLRHLAVLAGHSDFESVARDMYSQLITVVPKLALGFGEDPFNSGKKPGTYKFKIRHSEEDEIVHFAGRFTGIIESNIYIWNK